MPSILQLRGGSEAENDSYVGRPREVTVDITNKALRIHNGVTPGGFKLTSAGDTANQIAALKAELENQINLMQLDSQEKQTARCFSAMLIAAPNGGYYGSTTDINLPAAQSEPNGIRTYTITIPETAVYKLRQESFNTGSRYSEAGSVNSVVQNSAGVNLKSFRVHNGRGLTVVNEFQQGDKMIINIPFYSVTNSSESGDVLLTATFEKIGH